MLHIAIVEDNPDFSEELAGYIKRYCSAKNTEVNITFFSDGMGITDDYSFAWDIIFMDIEMPHLNGMDAARRIRDNDPSVIIIFVTSMAQYAIKGYEVDALDFVLKPVNYIQLSTRMDKALKLLNRDAEHYLMVPDEDGRTKLRVSDILFIEVRNHTLNIVTSNTSYTMRGTLGEMESALKDCHFSKCNQCFLVNLRNISKVKKDSVVLGDHELSISRPRKKQFLEEFSEYLGVGL